ncbi:PepSY-like domain-containing protein [Candidatus Sumerlaeota bacterium]|nr:PepSY-like domain-containing protein [Candidatus Sumerlaeota bacterium]
MKKVMITLAFMAVAGLIFLVYAEENLSLDKIPAAVRQTIEKYAEGAKINEIELEKENGKEVYDVEILKDGKEVDFMVSTDGQFLGFEEEEEDDDEEDDESETKIELAQAPQAVQDAIKKIVGDNPIKEVIEEKEDGVTTYEAEYTVGGMEHSLECAATGEILELESEIEADALPASVIEKLNKKFPGAVIKEACAVQVFFYEIEIEKDGKKQEIEINATGEIDDDDDD